MEGVRVARHRTGAGVILLAAASGYLAGEALRRPEAQPSARATLFAIDLYRATASPVISRTHLVVCRYEPSCSAYGREAIRRYGFLPGSALAFGRLLRCNPWAEGGEDPVP